MFYQIKKKIISSNMKKKKEKNPFQVEESETFTLTGEEDLSFNNSYFFTAHSETGDSVVLRLGLRNNLPSEVFFFLKLDGKLLVHPKDHFKIEECPTQIKCIIPGKTWEFSFDGELREFDSEVYHQVKVDATFEMTLPIFDFFYHSSSKGMAEAIAREKWTKEFFSEIGTNNQRHYEQTGFLSGSAIIDGETKTFKLPCVRDHSFGTRNWDYMDDHIWVCGMNDKCEVVNFSFVNYPHMKRIYLGYNNIGSDKNVILDGYKLIDYKICGGMGPDKSVIQCHFENGKTLVMTIYRDENVPIFFDNKKYVFQEAIGRFEIDGKLYRGTVEYGFNKDAKRWNY